MPRVEKEIIVNAPADTVYQIWRNFENFPDFMENIEDVHETGARRSHWKAKGPLGRPAEWDAEITVDEPGRAIGWSSVPGESGVHTTGRVDFEDYGGATRLHVVMQYEAPGGTAGEIVTKVFANPDHQVEEDLQRFKQAAERGREFSGFDYYMPKHELRPDQVKGRTTHWGEGDAGVPAGPGMADAVYHGHERQIADERSQHLPMRKPMARGDAAIREGKTSTATGTPSGTLGQPSAEELEASNDQSDKGGDITGRW